MKKCIKCGIEKVLTDFPQYKNRKKECAYFNVCKACTSEYKKEHYHKNKQAYLDRAKAQREKNPEEYKAYLNQYYRDNKEEILRKAKEYANTPKGLAKKKASYKKYYNNPLNQIKNKARMIVTHAKRNGTLVSPTHCESCGEEKFTEAHHEDYTKPLELIWLCKQCHENIHHLNEREESKK